MKMAYINKPPGDSSTAITDDQIRVDFANRLQHYMVKKGWNQSELARQAQLHLAGKRIGRDNVSSYVRGLAIPYPANLHALAKALGVTPEDLLPRRHGLIPAASNALETDLKVLGDGNAWLRINRAMPVKTALKIMSLIEGDE